MQISSAEIEAAAINGAVEKITLSEAFRSSSRLKELLRYVVKEELEGRGENIKAYSIGVDVLGKPESFDSQIDPIVRVTMGRLRTAIELYYANQASEDEVVVSIPKGTYRPNFSAMAIVSTNDRAEDEEMTSHFEAPQPRRSTIVTAAAVAVVAVALGYWLFSSPATDLAKTDTTRIAVTVREAPSSNLGEQEKIQSTQLAQMLKTALARNLALSILAEPEGTPGRSTHEMHYSVVASAPKIDGVNSLSVELVDEQTKAIAWSRIYTIGSTLSETPLRTIADQVAGELHTQILGASKRSLAGRDPDTLSAAQLYLLATWVPGPAFNTLEWEQERLDLARLAIKKDPDFGPAYSVMADKLAYLASMDGPSNTKAAAEELRESAARALELASGDPNTIFNVAQSQWHSGQLKASIRTMKRVLELDPNHKLAQGLLRVMPYTCAQAPDTILNEAIEFDKSLGPDNPIRWVTLSWLGWLHMLRDEYALALEREERAAQIFQIPYTFMRRAALLNLLGRGEDAAQLIFSQKQNWPNIDPGHFATVTIPRLCQEMPNSPGANKLLNFHQRLAQSIEKRRSK